MRSDGEEAGEPLGEDAKDEEPDTDADEDGTAPFLDRWSGGLEAFHGGLLGSGDEDREDEHQRDDDHGSGGESDDGGGEAAGCECVSGQTGQDRTRSTETGKEIEESEGGVASDGWISSARRSRRCVP